MGGFQKFPIPRYLHIQAWVVNPRWKLHVFNTAVPLFFISVLIGRHTYLTTHDTMQPGKYYVDPADNDSPKLLRF